MATAEGMVHILGVPPTVRCDGRGKVAGGGDLCLPPPGHCGAIYYY